MGKGPEDIRRQELPRIRKYTRSTRGVRHPSGNIVAVTANLGERFEIKGRNADASWYLICCVNGQQGWVSSQLTDEDNEELAPLVEAPAVPTPAPVAQAPAEEAPAAAPAEPAAEPEAAAPAPAADACAGIGGDGCKFKLTGELVDTIFETDPDYGGAYFISALKEF